MREAAVRFAGPLLGGALGVMLGALPSEAGAQSPNPDLRAQQAPAVQATLPRPTALESHFTRIRVGSEAGRRTADGIDVRVAFARRAADVMHDDDASALARRTELTIFLTHARDAGGARDDALSTTIFGAGLSLRPLPQPLAGRLDPFVALGAGLLRTTESVLAPPTSLRLPPRRVDVATSSAAIVPEAGLRLLVSSRLALQAQARDVAALGPRGRHDVAFGTGLRVAL